MDATRYEAAQQIGGPVSVVESRYGGTYSGAAVLAFNCDPEDVPDAVRGDDPTCAGFFGQTIAEKYVGRGGDVDEAVRDLRRRLESGPPDWLRDGDALDYHERERPEV